MIRNRVRLAMAAAIAMAANASVAASASQLEDRVVDELNFARTSPRAYADRLREYRSWFSGPLVTIPGSPEPVMTREGVAAVDEAIRFLDAQKPLQPLKSDTTLALAARDWAQAQGPRGGRGHLAANGRGPGDRVTARGGDKYVGETISYGLDEADLVVLQLIIDDGVAGRGHRKIIYDGDYAYAGAGCGPHAAYRYMCVIDYSFFPRGTFEPPRPRHAGERG